MARAWPVLLLLAAAALAGCLDPYRPHVPGDVLAGSGLAWEEERRAQESGGLLGPTTVETRYHHDPAGGGPPFPAVVQVFGIRELDARSTDDLLQTARGIVAGAVERENITLDAARARAGARVLASGVESKWFVEEGRVRAGGEIFDEDAIVRIVGEVGHDGRSKTSHLSVALVQTARIVRAPCPPLDPLCQGPDLERRDDLTTWRSVAADPDDHMGQARGDDGLLWNLVTHG